ncbi:MAG TPA: hypothetical protein V6C58_27425, partial [Allocoleopsis sp.]
WNDPASSGFPDDHSESIFEAEGISLWYQLREELYPDYEVYYLSDRVSVRFAIAIQFYSRILPN